MTECRHKYRHEMKYVISAAQIPLLRNRILGMTRLDPHAGSNGIYTIRSLYFDDLFDRCYYENENGTDPREKYRIRIYDHSSERIILECKRKERGKTRKSSCQLTKEQADQLIHGRSIPLTQELPPLLRKFSLEMQTRGLRPVVIVEYERIPYVYKNGNVRITFDTQIASSSSVTDFFSKDLPKRSVMPAGYHLLEVKYDEYLPDFIHQSLELRQLRQTNFSKYYLCRKFSTIK